ncbi:Ig-like domain-containing protein [Anaerocolumna sp. AGMB13025]|uniref:Ig-like domain-containing protein n=1 Tax=Anaerocolumna sp. AGMB13025 TaxID=3039116 RepID=UPI00241E15E7|nr:Ig-like domain-containing protein [Anaerocolumna sp. AGMB13025]WFR56012.1 Ig-like domain-containing protein [Anaerocolumna sp. AGMB13025]
MKRYKKMFLLMISLLLLFSNVNAADAAKISSYSLMPKETITITVDTQKSVTWKSSNKKIATVDKRGNIKAISLGETTITAKYGKKTRKFHISVKKPAVAIVVYTDTPGDTPTNPENPSSPDTDTYITKTAYDKLNNDITYDNAVDIIGINGSIVSTSSDNGQQIVTYIWYGENDSSATITFQDDKLSSKSEKNLK